MLNATTEWFDRLTQSPDLVLIGRLWDPAAEGPSPVLVTGEETYDLSARFPTVRDLCETESPAAAAKAAAGPSLGSTRALLAGTRHARPHDRRFLSPVDLQSVKAAGVTFVVSMLERMIEERAGGDATKSAQVRAEIQKTVSVEGRLVPGSDAAMAAIRVLAEHGLSRDYLEVGLGPDAELFTKCPTLASVGPYAAVGVPRHSQWNNPEPEVGLVADSTGRVVGATLCNDVNLRDVEGRSPLLLPQAKDNNASCAVGPFVRLFDGTFGIEEVSKATVELEVTGTEGFVMSGQSHMKDITRSPRDLVRQLFAQHDYPDGVLLMLGTMFAPVQDRFHEGSGFTHRSGDVVRISSDDLGLLENRVLPCDECPPWDYGLRDLMQNLSDRGLLDRARPIH